MYSLLGIQFILTNWSNPTPCHIQSQFKSTDFYYFIVLLFFIEFNQFDQFNQTKKEIVRFSRGFNYTHFPSIKHYNIWSLHCYLLINLHLVAYPNLSDLIQSLRFDLFEENDSPSLVIQNGNWPGKNDSFFSIRSNFNFLLSKIHFY